MKNMKKFFNNKKEAAEAKQARDPKGFYQMGVYKMPKGTRHSGEYVVCTYMEYLNIY